MLYERLHLQAVARPRGQQRANALSALGLLLVLAVEGAWAISRGEILAYVPRPLAVLPLGLTMLASAVIVLLGAQVAFAPAFGALRRALGSPRGLAAAGLALLLYVPAFLFGQDAIQRVAYGPALEVMNEGVPGFVPILIVFPLEEVGIALATYQGAVLLSLGLLLALNAAALAQLLRLRRGATLWGSAGLGVGGAGLGLLVWCPTCIAPPVIAFLSSYLLPVLSLAPMTQTVTVAAIYLLSLVLLVIALDNAVWALNGRACPLGRSEG